MVYIFKDRLIRVEWTIYKGISPVKEDFSRSNVKVFLLGNREKYLLQARADKGTLYVDIPSGLKEGTYSIEAIWVKNMDHVFDTRNICRSKREDLFSITEFEDEATNIGEGVVVLKVKTSTATYGYDGLSSYELAVLRGDWNGTEGEWLKHERYVSVLDSRGDSEVDTMSQKAITDELEAQDNAIEDIQEETSRLGDRVEEAEDKVNDMGDVVDEIKSHAPVSARPAGFKPDIDLTPEITVDRAWRDHEGNVIRDTYITRRGLRNEIIDITNQQVTDLKPGSVDPDDLSEATKQLIGNKSITNLPDEEDITVTDNQTLKLKDKEYAPKDYSGMGRVYLRKHYVNGVNTLTQHMMRKPNTIYIIQYDYCLAGQTIEVPENCVLDFQGGSLRNGTIRFNNTILIANTEVFNNITLKGNLLNDTCTTAWFKLDRTGSTDISSQIRGLFSVASNRVEFIEGTYLFSEVDVNFPAIIKGLGGVTIKPVVKYPNVASALKRVFTVTNQSYFKLDNISFIGDTQFIYNNAYIGDGLILCDKVKDVRITNCVFGDTVSGYPSPSPTPTTTIGQLITGQDCNYFEISHSEFYNNEAFEWINITMPTLKRVDLNVVFSDNYVHDYNRGATPLLAVCNKLEINRNLFERCYYTGSLLNAHGLYTEFKDNIIRESRMSSILDTSEWGQYRSESVTAENNDVECLNAVLVATLATNITIRNNRCKCFNALVALGASGNYTDKDTNTVNSPACETIIIEGNDFDFSHYNAEYNLPSPAYRAGVCVYPVYVMGTNLSIRSNKFKFVQDDAVDRRYFLIQNMYNVDFTDNQIDGIATRPELGFYKALIQYTLTKSKLVPISNREIRRLTYENNSNINTIGAFFVFDIRSTNFDWFKVDYMSVANNVMRGGYLSTSKCYIKTLNYMGNIGDLYLYGKTNAVIYKMTGRTENIQADYVGIMEKGKSYYIDDKLVKALRDCSYFNYLLPNNIGTTIRVGDKVAWSSGNVWQALNDVTLTDTDIPPDSVSLPAESILEFNGVYWIKVSSKEPVLFCNETGSTKERPILNSYYKGSTYYDITLNKPIWWTGANWVDATGATV
jgi:hypothetical protein